MNKKTKAMTTRLPLPLKTITEVKTIMSNTKNLWIKSPLKNVLVYLTEYEYEDAIKIMVYLKGEHPALFDYDKHIKAIKSAQKRYENI